MIVVSILLAFGLEALWSQHRERVVANEYLDAVIQEFREGRIQLDTIYAKNERALDATDRMLDLSRAEVESMTFDPSLGALNSLHTSGAIDGVEDMAIRTALDAWPGLVEDSREDTEPMLQASLGTVEAWAQQGMTPLMMDIARGTGDSLAVKHFLSAFPQDEVGKNRLAARGSFIFLYQTEIAGLSDRLDATLSLLEGFGRTRTRRCGGRTRPPRTPG